MNESEFNPMQRRLVATNISQDSGHRLRDYPGLPSPRRLPDLPWRCYAGGLILLSIATKYERGCEQSTNGSVERALGLGKIVQGGY
jgi:hypothetical protein